MTHRLVGTVVRGIRGPIIRPHDDLVEIVVDSLLKAKDQAGFDLYDKDVLAVTESVVAKAQNNLASLDQIGGDVQKKYKGRHLGLVFPILSRNRFGSCLKALARAFDRMTILLSYPSDEVGNQLLTDEALEESGVNPYSDILTEEEFRKHFPDLRHPFTGMDYVAYYRELAEGEDCQVEFIFSNRPQSILSYTDEVLVCNIHHRKQTKKQLAKAKTVYGLDDILTKPIQGSGYNPDYGLLGCNLLTDEVVKLFPRDGFDFVKKVQESLASKTGKNIEVMIYGDGAFKDPYGKIWELADPVVSCGYTKGLEGTPNEIKLKYVVDNEMAELKGKALEDKLKETILSHQKADRLSVGTTPRRIVDLLGSLCDLTSGSGDKGTPFIYIQHYFDNYAKD